MKRMQFEIQDNKNTWFDYLFEMLPMWLPCSVLLEELLMMDESFAPPETDEDM